MKVIKRMFKKDNTGKIIHYYNLKNEIYVKKNGEVYNHQNKLRKGVLSKSGYLKLKLIADDKKRYETSLHALVLYAYTESSGDGYVVNHINECKTDNQLENLEYLTLGENTQHTYNKGRIARGGKKIPVNVYRDGIFIGTFDSITAAGVALDIPKRSISKSLNKESRGLKGYRFIKKS